MLALGTLTNVGQVLQTDDTVWVAFHNAPTDRVVGSLFQPSLPSTHDDQSSGSGTGAFALQPLSQAAVMVSFGPGLFAGIEGGAIVQLRCDRQVALSHIHADHMLVGFGHRVRSLQFKRDEQVKLLAWLVIPQLCCPEMRPLLHQRKVLTVARIGHEHAPRERQDTHLLLRLQAIVAVVVVVERRGGVRWWLIESLVAFGGDTRLASFGIPPDLGPQGFVGSPDLTRNITGHLGRQMIRGAYFCIRLVLQPLLVALLAMRKRVATHIVQGVAVGQLRSSQGLELLTARLQFQFGGDQLLHRTSVQYFTENVYFGICEQSHPTQAIAKDAPFLPRRERRGLLARGVDQLCKEIVW